MILFFQEPIHITMTEFFFQIVELCGLAILLAQGVIDYNGILYGLAAIVREGNVVAIRPERGRPYSLPPTLMPIYRVCIATGDMRLIPTFRVSSSIVVVFSMGSRIQSAYKGLRPLPRSTWKKRL